MTDHHFFLQRHFAEGASEWWIEKERIVAEAIHAWWWFQKMAFDRAAECIDQFSVGTKRDHRNKPRCPVDYALHSFQQHPVIRLVRGIRASVTRGVNSRRSAQCIHLQARIVDKQLSFAMF